MLAAHGGMKLAVALGASLLVAAGACGRSQKTSAATAPSANASSSPFGVPGAHIEVADTDDGVDIVLTATTEEGAAELQWRARAQLYGSGAQRHGLRLTELPPLVAHVDDLVDGARLHLVAKLASQVDELRARVHARAEEVAAGPCD